MSPLSSSFGSLSEFSTSLAMYNIKIKTKIKTKMVIWILQPCYPFRTHVRRRIPLWSFTPRFDHRRVYRCTLPSLFRHPGVRVLALRRASLGCCAGDDRRTNRIVRANDETVSFHHRACIRNTGCRLHLHGPTHFSHSILIIITSEAGQVPTATSLRTRIVSAQTRCVLPVMYPPGFA